MDYDPATTIDGEYIVVFKQDAQDDESKSWSSIIDDRWELPYSGKFSHGAPRLIFAYFACAFCMRK